MRLLFFLVVYMVSNIVIAHVSLVVMVKVCCVLTVVAKHLWNYVKEQLSIQKLSIHFAKKFRVPSTQGATCCISASSQM